MEKDVEEQLETSCEKLSVTWNQVGEECPTCSEQKED